MVHSWTKLWYHYCMISRHVSNMLPLLVYKTVNASYKRLWCMSCRSRKFDSINQAWNYDMIWYKTSHLLLPNSYKVYTSFLSLWVDYIIVDLVIINNKVCLRATWRCWRRMGWNFGCVSCHTISAIYTIFTMHKYWQYI